MDLLSLEYAIINQKRTNLDRHRMPNGGCLTDPEISEGFISGEWVVDRSATATGSDVGSEDV